MRVLTTGLLLSLLIAVWARPCQLYNYTWSVENLRGYTIWSISQVADQVPWPALHPDLCKLALGAPANWDLEDYYNPDQAPSVPSPPGRLGLDPWGGCGHPSRRSMLRTLTFYVCPGLHRDRSWDPTCGGYGDFYCRNWGCETTGDVHWHPTSTWDFITVTANYTHHEAGTDGWTYKSDCDGWCHPLLIRFTDKGKEHTGWERGVSWGLRLYKERYDDGLLFTIKLSKSLPRPPRPVAIGPNASIYKKTPGRPIAVTPPSPDTQPFRPTLPDKDPSPAQ